MKSLRLILFLSLISTTTMGEGINFDLLSPSWADILAKAKSLNKPVFVDFYTSWCGPCKNMERKIYTDPSVGDFYNKNIISIKIDAEQGWGKILAQNNSVNAYPTLMYFSPQGNLLLESVGFTESPAFIKLGQLAVQNLHDGVDLEKLQKEIDNGNNDPAYLLSYIRKLSPFEAPNSLLIEKYLRAIPNDSLYNKSTLDVVLFNFQGYLSVKGEAFKVLYAAYQKYPVKSKELMSPWNAVRNRLLENVDSAGLHHNEQQLTELIEANNKFESIPAVAAREKDFLTCRYYLNAGEGMHFIEQSKKYFEEYISAVDTGVIYNYDRRLFLIGAKIKFHNPEKIWSYSDISEAQFRETFYSETQRAFDEINYLVSEYEDAFSRNNKYEKLQVTGWLNTAVKLYRNNPIFVDKVILKNVEKFSIADL